MRGRRGKRFLMCFYVALCVCPDCFALNITAGKSYRQHEVSAVASPQGNKAEGGRKILSVTSLQLWKNSFGSWAKGRLPGSMVRKSAQAARQRLCGSRSWRWQGWAFQIYWSGSLCLGKIGFGEKKWGEAGRGRFSLTHVKQWVGSVRNMLICEVTHL